MRDTAEKGATRFGNFGKAGGIEEDDLPLTHRMGLEAPGKFRKLLFLETQLPLHFPDVRLDPLSLF